MSKRSLPKKRTKKPPPEPEAETSSNDQFTVVSKSIAPARAKSPRRVKSPRGRRNVARTRLSNILDNYSIEPICYFLIDNVLTYIKASFMNGDIVFIHIDDTHLQDIKSLPKKVCQEKMKTGSETISIPPTLKQHYQEVMRLLVYTIVLEYNGCLIRLNESAGRIHQTVYTQISRNSSVNPLDVPMAYPLFRLSEVQEDYNRPIRLSNKVCSKLTMTLIGYCVDKVREARYSLDTLSDDFNRLYEEIAHKLQQNQKEMKNLEDKVIQSSKGLPQQQLERLHKAYFTQRQIQNSKTQDCIMELITLVNIGERCQYIHQEISPLMKKE
jgi:hypothetical protein